jgi:hypothetical protein
MNLIVNDIEAPTHLSSKISYEDILSKMNMFVSNGKLHLIDRSKLEPANVNANNDQNSYIFNKYFKDEKQTTNNIRKPKTFHEYKMMVIDDYIERERIKRLKTRKLIIPSLSENYAHITKAENKLFNLQK